VEKHFLIYYNWASMTITSTDFPELGEFACGIRYFDLRSFISYTISLWTQKLRPVSIERCREVV